MDNFYGGPMSLAEQQRWQQQQHQHQHQQQHQQQHQHQRHLSDASATTPAPGAVPVCAAEPALNMFSLAGGHGQQQTSPLASFAPQMSGMGMEPMLGFASADSHAETAFANYSFVDAGTANSGFAMAPGAAMPLTHIASPTHSPTHFSPPNTYSTLPPDMISSMLAFSGLDLGQMGQLNQMPPIDSVGSVGPIGPLGSLGPIGPIGTSPAAQLGTPPLHFFPSLASQTAQARGSIDSMSSSVFMPAVAGMDPSSGLQPLSGGLLADGPVLGATPPFLSTTAGPMHPAMTAPFPAAPPAMTPADRDASLEVRQSPLQSLQSLQPLQPMPSAPATTTSVAMDLVASSAPEAPSAPTAPPTTETSTSAALVPATRASTSMSLAGATRSESAPPSTKNYYSTSGFDMIRALYYVSSRPNPEIDIGPVDLSCAFVVCDATLDDFPIIYVSDNFQHLTGYSSYEILGQNCRFLQAPDGKVEAGSQREFTDNKAVYNLKQKLQAGREVQQSLINYRKGGKPFLNLLTMIPIPWDDYKEGYRYFIGLQIDLVESPDAISGQSTNSMQINYAHSKIPQYIWNPPKTGPWGAGQGRTLGKDDVSTLLQRYNATGGLDMGLGLGMGGMDGLGGLGGLAAADELDVYGQSWDKMLLENVDDVVHVLSLKGVFLYLSPSCKAVLEYDVADLLGNSLSSICHPSDIVPVTREMRDTQAGQPINCVFRVRRKRSGYTWFESHGSLLVEQGKGRKCIVLVGRKRPAFALRRCDVDANGGIGDSELWLKLSTSGMVLHASPNVRSLLDLQPDGLVGTSMQDLMRKESRPGFNRTLEKVRRGIIASCHHEVQHRRGQVLQAATILYPGDAERGEKPTFFLAQTRLLKPASRNRESMVAGMSGMSGRSGRSGHGDSGDGRGRVMSSSSTTTTTTTTSLEEIGPAGALGQVADPDTQTGGFLSSAGGGAVPLGSQDAALAADDNLFGELKTTRCSSWQFELRQMEKANRVLAEELGQLLTNRKKRKRRKGVGNVPRDCANCHTRNTPEWRRGPSGQRDLCNSCGLRWAKQVGRVSPRHSARGSGSKDGPKRAAAGAAAGAAATAADHKGEHQRRHSHGHSHGHGRSQSQESVATEMEGPAAEMAPIQEEREAA